MVSLRKKEGSASIGAELADLEAQRTAKQRLLDALPSRREAMLLEGRIAEAAALSPTSPEAELHRAGIEADDRKITAVKQRLADAQQREQKERLARLCADVRPRGRAGVRAHETAVAELARYAAIKAEITRLSPADGASLPHICPWLLDVGAMNAGRVAMPPEALSFDLLLTEALTRLERKLAA